MRIRALALALGASVIAIPHALAANPRPATIPALREWKGGVGTFKLRRSSRIVIPHKHRHRLRADASLLASDLAELTGRRHRVVASRRKRVRRGDVRIGLGARDPGLGREGYRMRIAGAVRIAANRPAGAFYGTRTFLQLMRQGPRLPRGRARDWPRYPERGLMVDVGRKYFTPTWLRSHVRELAFLKLNYLHLHLSDNQGFRIGSERHPEIVSEPHLTKTEVRALLALAERHHMTVVPEIDMPGHMQAALEPHPELQLRNAAGTPSPANLDYTLPEARAFARELVEEYLPLFPGPYWHMGADEYLLTVPGFQTPADYAAYPQLQEYARARYGPEATPKDGILGFVNEIGALVRGSGKSLRIWHDGLEGGRVVTVDPATVVDWWIDTAGPSPHELLAQGHRIMNAGWFPTYYVNGALGSVRPDMRTAYESWEVNEFYGPFVYDETAQNPPDVVPPGEPRNLGSKLHVWNDDPEAATESEIAEGIFPRLRVIAQKTWSSPLLTPSYSEFEGVGRRIGHAPRS
jgi:hexosaminidase